MREFGGAILLIEEPPEIEFRGGLFYIIDAGGVARAMRPNVLLRGFQNAAKALQDHYADTGATVIELRPAAHN